MDDAQPGDAPAIRRPHPAAHVHHGVDWFEIFSAGVLFAEALEEWHLKHHIARPTILPATVTLVMGLLHARIGPAIARHRVLHDAPAARSALLAARAHLGARQSVPTVDNRPRVS